MNRLIVFGGSGMIGRSVPEAASVTPGLAQTWALQRQAVSPALQRVTFEAVEDFEALGPLQRIFAQADAVIFVLGVSQNAVFKAEYSRVTVDYPLAAARCLKSTNPRAAFVFVSGKGVNVNGWSRYAQVKGEAE